MILGLSAATAAVAATGAVSSFAWFAVNDKVGTEAMTIKADSGQYLEIRSVNADNSGTWARTAAAISGKKELKPVSIGKLSNGAFTAGTTWSGHNWVNTSSDSVDDATKGTTATYTDVTSLTDVVSNNATDYKNNVYALVEEFDIRVRYLGDSSTAYKLTANVDWASTPDDASNKTNDTNTTKTNYYLHNAARVYFVVGAVNDETDTHAKAIDNNSTGKDLATSHADAGTSGDWNIKSDATGLTLVDSMTAKKSDSVKTGGDGLGNGVRVRLYFYFDGEDANCFSSAVLGSDYSIKVSFNVTKA